MSKTLEIGSSSQFNSILKESKIVVADFHAEWCGPCKAIAPFYEMLSASLSKPKQMTFTRINVDNQKEIAAKYNVTAMPTFMVFDNGKVVDKVQGADKKKLEDLVKKLAAQAGASSSGGSGSGSGWRIGELPRGYGDVTDQIEVKGLEILNSDDNVRVLIDDGKPSGLQKGKAAASAEKDWVESDTDEQLMLYMPFQANLKVHTIQITSLPPSATEDEDEELPMRPKTIQIYHNSAHALGFGEAEDIPATQTVELASNDWDSTGTATITLRFVKFQNVTSLVLFVVDGDGDGEKVRVDRVRIIGETGEKREMGKLEKIDHDH